MRQKAVFLDRDGVINNTFFRNGKPRAPDRVEDFVFLPGVEDAVKLLHENNFLTIVVTNQPDVARGWQSKAQVEAMNDKVLEVLKVHEIKVCYHDDQNGCDCRKPKPGMLIEAAGTWEVDLHHSFMVGDRAGDIEAGLEAGCKTILVDTSDAASKSNSPILPDFKCSSLLEAARWILNQSADLSF